MKSFSLKVIHRYDKENMLGHLIDFPLQCLSALKIAEETDVSSIINRDFKNIVFLGMGGSAIGGDLIRAYLYSEIKIPIIVLREYIPAYFLNKDSLVFSCSYSGNTEETISAYRETKEKKATVIVISSGGKLKEMSLENKDIYIQIPQGIPPRCALGYLSLVPLKILEKMRVISNREEEYKEMNLVLNKLKDSLHPKVEIKENIAKYIASKIYNKLPLIYSSSLNFDVVVSRFRAQLNENAKVLALSNLFPEMNHNEIEGFVNSKNIFKYLVAIFLKDNGFHPQVKKRLDITSQIIKEKGIPVLEIQSQGRYLLSRLFSLIYIVDFISFYLAILYGTDPTPVKVISYLKQRLKD